MNILIAVDLSDSSSEVVNQAVALLGHREHPHFWILHVVDPDPDFVGYDAGPQTVRDSVAKQFHQEHRQIQGLAERLRDQGSASTALLLQGAIAEKILEEATRVEADLVVVGSHGKGMARKLLLGSTSESVMRHSEVPVLVIPTHDRQ